MGTGEPGINFSSGTGSIDPAPRHTLRDRRPSKAAYPACWAMWGQRNCYSVQWGKKICTGPTRAVRAEQKSLVQAVQAQWTNQETTTLNCPLWVAIRLSFNIQQGPPLSSLFRRNIKKIDVLTRLAACAAMGNGTVSACMESILV
jgi:hypothetical protein